MPTQILEIWKLKSMCIKQMMEVFGVTPKKTCLEQASMAVEGLWQRRKKTYLTASKKPRKTTLCKEKLPQVFEYFSFFNVTELARRAGINPTLMRQYTCGVKKAGEKTYSKLSACINDIRKDIIAASF